MKTIAEQIRDLEATRAAKAARMNEVVQKSMDEGRSTDESEQEEFDTLDTEIKQIDGDLVRLKRLESLAIQKGRTVVDDGEKSGEGRGAPTLMLKKTTDVEDKFEGQSFVRKLIAKACAIDEAKELGMPGRSPAQIAEARWGKTNPTLVNVIKAGVEIGRASCRERV